MGNDATERMLEATSNQLGQYWCRFKCTRRLIGARYITQRRQYLLENVLKMQEERAGETRARDVSCGQVRHRLFLVKRQDMGPFRIMQTCHLKVSKSKTTWPDHVDKRYKRYKEMLTWPKDM